MSGTSQAIIALYTSLIPPGGTPEARGLKISGSLGVECLKVKRNTCSVPGGFTARFNPAQVEVPISGKRNESEPCQENI